MSNHTVALRFAEAGLSVFPTCAETKRPLVRFTSAATTLARGIDYFWTRYGANTVPALHLSAAGLVAIDLDRGHGDGADGIAEFDKLLDQYGELPVCPVVRTPRGGAHLYFRQPAGREPLGNSASRIANGVDVRAHHGFVIAPGAVMATGEYYENIAGTPDLADAFMAGTIPEVPAWLAELAERPATSQVPVRGPSSAVIPESRLRSWALAVLEGEAAALAATPVRCRNENLNKAAFVIASKGGAHGVVAEDEAWSALWAACVSNGYIADDGSKAFERSFYSGWNDGLCKPSLPPERLTNIDPQFFAGLSKPRTE